jgi:hypothetical protein
VARPPKFFTFALSKKQFMFDLDYVGSRERKMFRRAQKAKIVRVDRGATCFRSAGKVHCIGRAKGNRFREIPVSRGHSFHNDGRKRKPKETASITVPFELVRLSREIAVIYGLLAQFAVKGSQSFGSSV